MYRFAQLSLHGCGSVSGSAGLDVFPASQDADSPGSGSTTLPSRHQSEPPWRTSFRLSPRRTFMAAGWGRTVKWDTVIGINIVTSLPKFLTGHNSRTNKFIWRKKLINMLWSCVFFFCTFLYWCCAAHVCTLFSSTANLRESYGSHVY